MKTIYGSFTLEHDPRVRKGQLDAIRTYESENGITPLVLTNISRWPMDLYHTIFTAKNLYTSEVIYKLIASYYTDKTYFEGFREANKLTSETNMASYWTGRHEGYEEGIKAADAILDRMIVDGTLLKVAKKLEGISKDQLEMLNKVASESSKGASTIKFLLGL